MSDYISREAAHSEACKGCSIDFPCEPCEPQNCEIKARLEAIPAADVVEVVRCSDCKYDERCMVQEFVRDERVEPYDKTVFFCADGKRKGGGQDE